MKLWAVSLVLFNNQPGGLTRLIAGWQLADTPEDATSKAIKQAAKMGEQWTSLDSEVIEIPEHVRHPW